MGLLLTVRSQGNLHFDKENVEQRQDTIQKKYTQLTSLAQQRHDNLEDAISYYHFCRECDSFEAWMGDQETTMTQKESLSENMEAVRRRFETLITDMAAKKHILDEINAMANQMQAQDHNQKRAIKKRQKDINDRCVITSQTLTCVTSYIHHACVAGGTVSTDCV